MSTQHTGGMMAVKTEQTNRLFGGNPLWDLIAHSDDFTQLRKSTLQVMLTEVEHERLTLQTMMADREVDPETGYDQHITDLEEKALVLQDLLDELERSS